MADTIHGQKMSDYTPLSDLTQAEQETYLANAAVTTYGKTSVGGANTNVNVPLSAIKPDVPVTDVQVGGTSVVSSGVAAVPAIPDAASLADGTTITASNGKLSANVSIPVTDVQIANISVLDDGVAVIPKTDWTAGSSSIACILNKPNLAAVATSGSYNDLEDKPTIPEPQVNADWTSSSGVAVILHKPNLSIYAETSSLATVATSGSYEDLEDKPTIPVLPTLATVATSGSYNDLVNKPNIPSIPALPSGASDNEYVLGFKDGALAWVKLEARSGSGSSATSYNVYYTT